jgi:hypothetical protein
MNRRPLRLRSSSVVLQGLRAAGLIAAVAGAASCHDGIDTTRKAPPKATLGDDIYGVLCDRVGASSLTEDLTGASYHAVCHYANDGTYADKVDTSVLPPPSGDASERARVLGVAKVEVMARRRSELVRALNAAFPDTEIDNVATPEEGDKVRLHDALLDFAKNLAPLYESNPFDAAGEPVMPASTRSLGRLFAAITESEEAREAFAKIAGRKGYRPSNVGLGAIRPALAYPGLRDLTRASLAVLGPDGQGAPLLQNLFRAMKHELKTSAPSVAPLAPYAVNPATVQPNRPRSSIEFVSALFLRQDPVFAADPSEPPRYIALRDRRGFARPATSGLGVPAPFVDGDGDGLADVDAFGRFVDNAGLPLAIDPPFAIPGVMGGPVDAFGRPEAGIYQYVDTSRTAAGAIARTLLPLVDATQYDPAGGADAWQNEHETLMYSLAGAYMLYGDREDAQYDFETETIVPTGESCSVCLPYKRFRGEDSPLPGLLHAAGQILADENSDALLEGVIDLLKNHESTMARLVGAALKVRAIALAHDELARQGKEPFARMPYQTPIWDEVATVMGRIAARPGLVKSLIASFYDPAITTETDGSKHIGDSLSKFVTYRDEVTYDTADINGPTYNVTTGTNLPPSTPVDIKKPRAGKNRSALQRAFQMIHDANGAKACNKLGAKAYLDLNGFPAFEYPFFSSYDECELFSIENLGAFYLDSVLAEGHPKRSELRLQDGFITGITDFLGVFIDPGVVFEDASGIAGMTLHPTPAALNRLVFFGATSEKWAMPDLDLNPANEKTNLFISNLLEPVAPSVCPMTPSGTRACTDKKDLLRLRDANTIFLFEHFGFYSYLRPVVTAFANVSCNEDVTECDVADTTGEQMFVDLVDVMNRHWPGKEHGDECDSSGDAASNPKYCSEAGVNSYEPILAEAFASDIVPALVEFSQVASEVSAITVKRGANAGQVWTGAEVLERMARILFDPGYADFVNMVDRKGNKSPKWVDGTVQHQLTGYSLFADSLHAMDERFDKACSCSGKDGQEQLDCEATYDACREDAERRKGQWKRSRSQLVDQFLAVEGEGQGAQFKNRAGPKILLGAVELLREQLNANCPNREAPNRVPCTWAKKELGRKLETTLSGPMFAALMDVQEALRADEPARREVERLLTYLLSSASDNDALQSALASMSDLVQVLGADGELSPIFRAIAGAAAAGDDPEGAGVGDTTVKVLKALTGDEYDKYHVLDHLLPALVTPMDGGQGLSPIEVFMDVIADVNRIDAASDAPLVAEDYKAVMSTMHEFMGSKTRGMEQLYTIVQKRPRE